MDARAPRTFEIDYLGNGAPCKKIAFYVFDLFLVEESPCFSNSSVIRRNSR